MNITSSNCLGKRFGKLTVIKRDGSTHSRKAIWLCLCDCGKETKVISASLNNGHTKSCGCLAKLEFGIASKNMIYASYEKNAIDRNLKFSLTKKEFYDLTQKNCHYCGIEPKQVKSQKFINGNYVYNGIDRKNNKLGYELLNCVSCCKKCNFAKGSMSYNEFIEYIKKLACHKVWEN